MTETTVRVDTKRLDDIMNMVGSWFGKETVLKRLVMRSPVRACKGRVNHQDDGDLQSTVIQTRMQPIKRCLVDSQRLLDLARNLKKK